MAAKPNSESFSNLRKAADNCVASNHGSRHMPSATSGDFSYPTMASHMNNYPQSIPNSYIPYNMAQVLPRGVNQNAPPVPPRPDQTYHSNYNRFGNGSMYNPYSRLSSGLFSPGMSGYRTPFNRYGSSYYDGSFDNGIIQLAEESTRPAFQSIESIVAAVSSISMMLESTYHAVHSSYSAILGVVEHVSRLKAHLTQMLSFLALLRGLQWLCLKVLYLLGIRKENPSAEAAWSAATNAANSPISVPDGADFKQSAWPILIFMSLVFGAPWLMFKLFAKTATKKPLDPSQWVNENGSHHIGIAMFDFNAARPQELSFRAGQKLILAPKNLQRRARGWLLASLDGKTSGFVPVNYLGKKASTDEPVVIPTEQKSAQPFDTLLDTAWDPPTEGVKNIQN